MPVSFFFIVPNKSRPPHAGGGLPTGPLPALHPFWVGRASVGIFTPHQPPSPTLTPFLGRPGQCGYFFCATPAGGRLATIRIIYVQRAPYTVDLQWNPGVRTLLLGHRGSSSEKLGKFFIQH
ncbi:hypothetical protein AVEN_218453-1 [Araneus ventricosus]|uniref:Uncharacterized protein n=1 Tax=Araneus ventricosus TaxID=182803 RepID=A0A4Y2SHB2_ARAVE|nr:hypothetical protein AVEN_250624-1 [Araneus ventricosus]GBN91981.1 hypothetical protein AVEN_218453-1 [Araneus ventricosus]